MSLRISQTVGVINGFGTCQRWQVPSKSAISEARQRVGPQVMSWLFALVVRPLATLDTPGAFLNGLRLMAVDGTVFDVPDTEVNARVPTAWENEFEH